MDVTALKPAELPAAMKDVTPEDRLAYVQKMAETRKALQAKIQEVSKAREAWLAAKNKENAIANTLETAVRQAVREQAAKMGFTW